MPIAEDVKKIRERKEFMEEIGSRVELGKNEQRTIVVDRLEDCDIHLSEEARLTFVALLSQGWQGKKRVNFHLEGREALLQCIILTIGKASDQFDFETFSLHTAENTKAFYYVRSAMFDKSRVNYEGTLLIKPQAQLADAYLSHHTLILSPQAKTRTRPSLEIEANEVKAGHAATMGTVDDELLFYLASRGIDRATAVSMMIKGFMEVDVRRMEDEELRQLLMQNVEEYVKKC